MDLDKGSVLCCYSDKKLFGFAENTLSNRLNPDLVYTKQSTSKPQKGNYTSIASAKLQNLYTVLVILLCKVSRFPTLYETWLFNYFYVKYAIKLSTVEKKTKIHSQKGFALFNILNCT